MADKLTREQREVIVAQLMEELKAVAALPTSTFQELRAQQDAINAVRRKIDYLTTYDADPRQMNEPDDKAGASGAAPSNFCQHCRHWTPPRTVEQLAVDGSYDVEDVLNDPSREEQINLDGYGTCAALASEGGRIPPDAQAAAMDSEDYRATFRCRATFGCSLFSPKP